MKTPLCLILAGCLLQAIYAPAAIRYVDLNGTNPTPPFTNWSTAATGIQDAVDAAIAGDEIAVSNGVYATGGRVVYGLHTNRVVIDKPITVRSVNGPLLTAIQGFPTNSESAVRCVYLTNGASLFGFTMTNGSTRNDGDYPFEFVGGGAFCDSTNVVVSNCVFSANSANLSGGGAFGGTLINCVFMTNYAGWQGGGACDSSLINCTFLGNESTYGGGAYNSALTNCALLGNFTHDDSDHTSNGGGASDSMLTNCVLQGNSSLRGGGVAGGTSVNCSMVANSAGGHGGGASGTTLINCTVIGNRAGSGGGVSSSSLTNCIVYFNTAPIGTNYSDDSTFDHCDTTPLPVSGAGNISTDPLLADFKHISAGSPCRGAGLAAATTGVDIDGDTWLNPPSIGCDEFYASSATGALSVAISATYTNVATSFVVDFVGWITGHATSNRWDFGDGTTATNILFLSHSWPAAGNYTVTLTVFNTDHPAGVSAAVTFFVLHLPVHYVSPASTTPVAPFTSWATAARNIQDAADAAFADGTVIVSNGVYQTGARVLYGTMTNRVAVIKPLTLQSVNGPVETVIDGGNAVRCLYLSNRVSVTGFTLRNGFQANGAGVYCQSAESVLSDCVLSGNASPNAWTYGGGAYNGVLNRCVFTGNSASYTGGGAAYATLNSCVLSNNLQTAYGGGAYACTVNNCLVRSNSAGWGGGLADCTVNNSIIISNAATSGGGGLYYSPANNCTIVGNYVTGPGGFPGGGGSIGWSPLTGCIIYYNPGGNYFGFSSVSLDHCCTTPDPGGPRNITDPPLFVNLAAGDFRLQSNSPCINSGNNAFVSGTNDFGGLARVKGGTVDIGAHEFQTPTTILSYAWAQHYGYPTDGSADFLDPDGDGMKNWQEWIAGTSPTNALSVLRMFPPSADSNTNGITVTWQSTAGTYYFLQRSTNLAAPASFTTVQSDIYGSSGTTSFLDESATNNGPYFYRVGVR